MRIGLGCDCDQHGRDTGKTDEAALHGVMGFAERLGTRKNPAQGEQDDQQRPDDGRKAEQDFADDRRQLPDLVRRAPGIAEARKPKHDAEEGGWHDRRLESVAHGLPQQLAHTSTVLMRS